MTKRRLFVLPAVYWRRYVGPLPSAYACATTHRNWRVLELFE